MAPSNEDVGVLGSVSFVESIAAFPSKLFGLFWENYVALALVGALNVATSSLCFKVISKHASVFQAISFRGLFVSIALFLCIRWKNIPVLKPRNKLPFVIARGAVGAAAMTCLGLASKLLPLSDVGFLVNSYPVVTTVLVAAMGMEKLSWISWMAVAGCIAGNALVSQPPFIFGENGKEWDLNRVLGLVFAILNSVLLGTVIIIIKLGGKEISPLVMSLSFHVFSFLYSVPFLIAGYPESLNISLTAVEIASYCWLLVCGTVLAPILTKGFQIGPPTKTTCLFMTNMLLSVVFGVLFFSEALSWISVLGAMTIVVSVLVVVSQRSKPVTDAVLDANELGEALERTRCEHSDIDGSRTTEKQYQPPTAI